LYQSRAVSHEDEADFSTGAFVVDPTPYLDILVLKTSDIFNVYPFHDAQIIRILLAKVNEKDCTNTVVYGYNWRNILGRIQV
jgi:hypothetical protein